MDESISELAAELEARIGPLVRSFAAEESIIKLSVVCVSVALRKDSLTLDDISKHVAFVCILDLCAGGCLRLEPSHFAIAMHLRIDKVTDVMSSIRPLEFSIALYLRVFEVAAVDEVIILLHLSSTLWAIQSFADSLPPLLVAFAVDLAIGEGPSYLDGAPLQLLDSFAFHLVSDPVSRVLRSVTRLLVLPLSVE